MASGIRAFFKAIFSFWVDSIYFFLRLCLATVIMGMVCWAGWHWRMFQYDVLTVWSQTAILTNIVVAFTALSVAITLLRRIGWGLRWVFRRQPKAEVTAHSESEATVA